MVLLPEQFHLPRRLARTIRKQVFQVSADTAFADVISSCGSLRKESGEGTWITKEMKDAYIHLFELGFAHSVECWFEGELAGGLYGVCLDRVFFGESMFSRKTDASKIGLATLVRYAQEVGIRAIDCQMSTAHLLRFGSREIEREEFQDILERFIQTIVPQKKWRLQ
jgi:leucyl/phenylalanyl-tRNA--protein transferase